MSSRLLRVRSHVHKSKRNSPVCWCSGGSIHGQDSHTRHHLGTRTHTLSVTATIIQDHFTCTGHKLHTTNIQWYLITIYLLYSVVCMGNVCVYVGILPHTPLRYTFTVLPIFSQQITTETRALVTGTKVVTPSIVHDTLICSNLIILRAKIHMGFGTLMYTQYSCVENISNT